MTGVEKMAFFETLMIKRTISVEMIITLLQQMILCDYITDVSRNLTFIIFIAQIICYIVVLKVLKLIYLAGNTWY